MMDRYDIYNKSGQCIAEGFSVDKNGDWCKYTDVEQAMAEKDARIARLEEEVSAAKVTLSAYTKLPDLRAFLRQVNIIKADAIDEMVSTFFTDEYQIAELVKKDILEYTNKLRSNK